MTKQPFSWIAYQVEFWRNPDFFVLDTFSFDHLTHERCEEIACRLNAIAGFHGSEAQQREAARLDVLRRLQIVEGCGAVAQQNL